MHVASSRKEARHLDHGPDHIGPIIARPGPRGSALLRSNSFERKAAPWPLLTVHQSERVVTRANFAPKAAFGKSMVIQLRQRRLPRTMLCRRILDARSPGF